MLEAVKQAVVSPAGRLGNIVHTYVHHQHCRYHHPLYHAGTKFALVQSKCFEYARLSKLPSNTSLNLVLGLFSFIYGSLGFKKFEELKSNQG